jgi:hypothetical protein
MTVLAMAQSFQQGSWEIKLPASSVDNLNLADRSIENSVYLLARKFLESDEQFHSNLASYKMGSKRCKFQRSKILLVR